jgi:type II secretion system protein I
MFGPVPAHVGGRQFLIRIGSPGTRASARRAGFTLMEVMIACGIFFMATFAILALVSTTLRNARALQRRDIDAGMAASQVYETLKTNRMEQGSMSGDFGEGYPGFSWEAVWDLDWDSGVTNGLLKVDIVVNRRGNRLPMDSLSIRVFAPDARSGSGQPSLR